MIRARASLLLPFFLVSSLGGLDAAAAPLPSGSCITVAAQQYGLPPSLLIALVTESPGRHGVTIPPSWREVILAQGVNPDASACTNLMASALVLQTSLRTQETIHDSLLVFSQTDSATEADAFAGKVVNTMRRLAELGSKAGLSGLRLAPNPSLSTPANPFQMPNVAPPGKNSQVWRDAIQRAAKATGLDAGLIHAVVRAESGYNPKAVSPKGAGGLMQLMPATAKRYGVQDRFDPEQNLMGGSRYLKDLLILFNNDLKLAIAAYNAGEGAVMRYGNKIPPFAETQNYVPKVLAYWISHRTHYG
jgi:soluble lytic murein transglycosylase-like protein